MRVFIRVLVGLLVLGGILAAGAFLYGRSEWVEPGPLAEATNVVIPRGSSQARSMRRFEQACSVEHSSWSTKRSCRATSERT